jgi:hypothetical protein
MDAELQNQLYEKYPDLFSNKNKSRRESCMARGIECNNGWYELLGSVCWRIFQHDRNIADPEYIPVKFDQIKEKYGGLRVYYSGGDDYIRGIVSMAEEYSYKVCGVCGNSGKPNKGGWITTLCESCREKTCQTTPQ